MGGSANQAIEEAGIQSKPYTAWAHIQPHHTGPENLKDSSNRIPAYESANQVHSAFEVATKGLVNNYGEMGVTRQVANPIPGGSGVHATMNLGVLLPTSYGYKHVDHEQPSFSSAGARSGDAQAIQKFVEREHFKEISREAGAMSESESESEDLARAGKRRRI